MKHLCIAAIALLMARSGLGQELSTGIRLGGGSTPACLLIATGVGPRVPSRQGWH